eukprot:5779539-Amphidinium_carterae.1
MEGSTAWVSSVSVASLCSIWRDRALSFFCTYPSVPMGMATVLSICSSSAVSQGHPQMVKPERSCLATQMRLQSGSMGSSPFGIQICVLSVFTMRPAWPRSSRR